MRDLNTDTICHMWLCPTCGLYELVSYEWLAQNGNPICTYCDEEMVLTDD